MNRTSLTIALLLLALPALPVVPTATASECRYNLNGDCLPGPGSVDVDGLPTLLVGPDVDLYDALGGPSATTAAKPRLAITEYLARVEIKCQDGQGAACAINDLIDTGEPPPDVVQAVVDAVQDQCSRRDCAEVIGNLLNCTEEECVDHPIIDELRECLNNGCIDTKTYVELVLGIVDSTVRLIQQQCETDNRCNPARIIEDVEEAVSNAFQQLCSYKAALDCVADLVPNPCPTSATGATVNMPSGTRDSDGDGIPVLVSTRTRVEVGPGCTTTTTNEGSTTTNAPDTDDSDPDSPVPSASSLCQQHGGSSFVLPMGHYSEDRDGDGVPNYYVRGRATYLNDNCGLSYGTYSTIANIGPDFWDTNPDLPLDSTPCGSALTYNPLVPSSYSTQDADGDSVPVITVHRAYYEFNSDCSYTTSPGPSTTVAIDTDDTDPNVPAPINKPPCEGQERTVWVPTGYASRDFDGDGISVYNLRETSYHLDEDCDLNAGSSRVDGAEYGDPDDGDPDNPIDQSPEPCTPQSVWLPIQAKGKDSDSDGVPQYKVQERRVDVRADCSYTLTPYYRNGTDYYGDPDDYDRNNPGYDCTVWNPTLTPTFPDGIDREEDADGDGVSTIHTRRVRLQFNANCTPYLEDAGTRDERLPDAWDHDPDLPVHQRPCYLAENTYNVPWTPQLVDEDGDGVPLLHGRTARYELAPDCTLTWRQYDDTGQSWGDPDDTDPTNPVCAAATIPGTTLPRADLFTRDVDGDGVPVIGYGTARYEFTTDCQLRVTDNRTVWMDAPDTDDADSDVPVDPTPTPCTPATYALPWLPIVEDQDEDGVPLVTYREADFIVEADCRGHFGGTRTKGTYGDPDDADPLNPINCLSLGEPSPRFATGETHLADDDGDDVPRLHYWTAEHRIAPDCTLTTTDHSLADAGGPDPDDNNSNDPVSITEPCWRHAGAVVPGARVADTRDQDGDGVPQYDVETRWRRLQPNCNLNDHGVFTTQTVGDPDDADPGNPFSPNPCEPLAGTHWFPLGHRIEDLDEDGVPVVVFIEHGFEVAPDCGDTTSDEQTRDGARIGDPDDADPYNPIPDPGAICPGAGQDCRLVLPSPTGEEKIEDQDGDGHPVAYVEVADVELSYNPGNPGLRVISGSERWVRVGGDVDDLDPDAPVPRDPVHCQTVQGEGLLLPTSHEVRDDDGDGSPRLTIQYERHELNPDCTLTATGETATGEHGPDPDDADPNVPLPGDACAQAAGTRWLPHHPEVRDADQDRVPRVVVVERPYTVTSTCQASIGTDEQDGDSFGDPNDGDADLPVLRDPEPCAALSGLQFPVPEGAPEARDEDGDGVPSLAQTMRVHDVAPDCTLHPTPEAYTVEGGPDPDDGNSLHPLPVLPACSETVEETWLPDDVDVRDADDDGLPRLVVLERRHLVADDCTTTATEDVRDSSVQAGDDDLDPDYPVPQDPEPCLGLAPLRIPLPDSAPVVKDEDGDGWPIISLPTRSAWLGPDCTLQEEPGSGFWVYLDRDDNDPLRPLKPYCTSTPTWSLPSDVETVDADGDGVPVARAIFAEYALDADCQPYPTGETSEGPALGDTDDSDPLRPGTPVEPCQGDAPPCVLGEANVATMCRIRDADEDGISSVHLCTQTFRFRSNGTIESEEPQDFVGPLGDVDDSDPERPIPYHLTADVWREADKLLADVGGLIADVEEAEKALVAAVQDAANHTAEDVAHLRDHVIAEVFRAINTLERIQADADAYMICAGERTGQYADLMDARILGAATDPSPGNMNALVLAATDGSATYAAQLRRCNGASVTLDFLYQEVRLLCSEARHYVAFGGHVLGESLEPVADLHRIFAPGTPVVAATLESCLQGPYHLAASLTRYAERTVDALTRMANAYLDMEGSPLLDMIRDLLQPDYNDPVDAGRSPAWIMPGLLLLLLLVGSTKRRRFGRRFRR